MPAKFWSSHTIQTELESIIERIGHMPCRRELEELNRGDLNKAIQKTGGYKTWADRLGIAPTKQRWSLEKIERMILANLVDERMPTVSELTSVGLSSLSSAIVRTGGFKHWQNKLRLDNKQSETHIGQEWEDWALIHLSDHDMKVESQSTRHPFDLLVNTIVRIDVKVAHFTSYKTNHGKAAGYVFHIHKSHSHDCDLYMLICLSDVDKPQAVYYIPAASAPKTTITITPNGKYTVFRDNLKVFDIL